MDMFAYQPPNTHSPGRYGHSPSAGPADPSSSSFAPRPGSSSGAHASGGFTATLPPLQEHATTDVTGSNGSGGAAVGGARPTLVEFEQLAGEDAFGAVGGDAGDRGYAQGGFGGAATGVGFRDPFARPGSTGGQAGGIFAGAAGGAVGMDGATSQSPSQHAYFNPQTINPSVNTRNTRPMTAPSGHGYIGTHSYSAAPSNFYAPAQLGSFDSYHGAPPHTTVPPPGPSTFQYQADSNPHAAEYDSYRARGFSLPDVNGNTLGMGVDPLVQVTDGTSPPSSTPFFYTPPAAQSVRPMTTGGMFYPAVLDPHASAVMPAPLVGAPGSVLPPGGPFGHYSSDNSRPGSSSGAAAATTRRRSSGGVTVQAAASKQYNFVQQGGQVTKRPRRRYDEIERMYNCDYPGCTKAYGTLNHLNSHKTMQKHGPKSTPAQFKEIRKAWRERKKAEAAAAARAQAGASPQVRGQANAPNGGAPPLVPISDSTTDRPRPSTSAGEYHVTMPAPYMSAGGVPPVLPYEGDAGPMTSAMPVGRALHVGLLDSQLGMYPGAFPSSVGGPFDAFSNGANRPVTAPSYYVAPSFGSVPPHHPLAAQSTASHQPSPLGPGTSHARYMNPLSSTLGAAASADRRFSLPVSSLGSTAQFQLPPPPATAGSLPPPPPLSNAATTGTPASPEMKMPQPMPPAATFTLLASSGGAGAGGGGAAEEVSAQ